MQRFINFLICTCAHRFCLDGNFYDQEIVQCKLDPSIAFADCTHWNPNTLNSLTTADASLISSQLLPNISAISEACFETILEGVASMYHAESGENPPPPARQECSTNCVLTVRNVRTCEASSVLLLERVYHEEAVEFLTKLKNRSFSACQIGMDCCGISRQLPSSCMKCKYPTAALKKAILTFGAWVSLATHCVPTLLLNACLMFVYKAFQLWEAIKKYCSLFMHHFPVYLQNIYNVVSTLTFMLCFPLTTHSSTSCDVSSHGCCRRGWEQ